jgi:hypothetical protein
MSDFLKMDIFFLIATLAVVALSILGAIAFWRIVRILKNVDHISEQVALESDNIRKDLADARADIRQGKSKIKSLLGFFGKTVKRASKDL